MTTTVRIKIIDARAMGMFTQHNGETYPAVRIRNGYGLVPRFVSHLVVDDQWIARGWAELVGDRPPEPVVEELEIDPELLLDVFF